MKQYHNSTRLMLLSALLIAGASFFVPAIFAEGTGTAAKTPVSAPGGNPSAGCLGCHGPFEKMASVPPFFVAPSGEKVNPHLYVPHDLKEVPDCLSCHKPHSASPTPEEIAALPKANVTTCFECHHKRTFENCQHCHKRS